MHHKSITLLNSNAEFRKFPGSISRTFVLGGRVKFVFIFRKCTKTLLQQCRIQKFSRGQYSRPPFLWRGKFVLVLQNVPKLSYSNAEFKKFLCRQCTGLPFQGRGKLVLFLRKCTKTILQQCRISKNSRTSGPPFLGREGGRPPLEIMSG